MRASLAPAPNRAGGRLGAAQYDALLSDGPLLQGYIVFEIDERQTGPLAK
jgi:hypothetical protein